MSTGFTDSDLLVRTDVLLVPRRDLCTGEFIPRHWVANGGHGGGLWTVTAIRHPSTRKVIVQVRVSYSGHRPREGERWDRETEAYVCDSVPHAEAVAYLLLTGRRPTDAEPVR